MLSRTVAALVLCVAIASAWEFPYWKIQVGVEAKRAPLTLHEYAVYCVYLFTNVFLQAYMSSDPCCKDVSHIVELNHSSIDHELLNGHAHTMRALLQACTTCSPSTSAAVSDHIHWIVRDHSVQRRAWAPDNPPLPECQDEVRRCNSDPTCDACLQGETESPVPQNPTSCDQLKTW
jgi:hypothetical protein